MSARAIAIFRAAHFLPSLTVTALTFALAWRTSDLTNALVIALTFFTGQLIIGWSNDLLDYSDDLAHDRQRKPLVAGLISPRALQIAIAFDALALTFLTLFGALSGRFGLLHLLAVFSALAYNVKLKSTIFSFLPYLLSFGLLPIIVLGATKYPIAPWMPAIGALFGVGAHFANVFKDLEQDRASGIAGLPQVLGAKYSRIGCSLSFGSGALILFAITSRGEALAIVIASTIFLFPIPRKLTFPFAMLLGIAVMASFISAIPN